MTAGELSAIVGIILLSLGVTAPVSEFVAGLFMAVAMAFLLMAWSQPEDRKSYWLTLATSVMFAIITAMLHNLFFKDWLLQVKMALSGAISKWIAEGLLGFGRSLKEQMSRAPKSIHDRLFGKKVRDE